MTPDKSLVLDELALFADIGTEPPKAATAGQDLLIRMTRNGEEISLLFHETGRVTERWPAESPRKHLSYRALLASDRFGDLRRWADVQAEVLRRTLGDPDQLINVQGTLSAGANDQGVPEIDHLLFDHKRTANDSTHVLLIDGPAGIGKNALHRTSVAPSRPLLQSNRATSSLTCPKPWPRSQLHSGSHGI